MTIYLSHGYDDNPFQVIFRSLRESLDFLELPRFCKQIHFLIMRKENQMLKFGTSSEIASLVLNLFLIFASNSIGIEVLICSSHYVRPFGRWSG